MNLHRTLNTVIFHSLFRQVMAYPHHNLSLPGLLSLVVQTVTQVLRSPLESFHQAGDQSRSQAESTYQRVVDGFYICTINSTSNGLFDKHTHTHTQCGTSEQQILFHWTAAAMPYVFSDQNQAIKSSISPHRIDQHSIMVSSVNHLSAASAVVSCVLVIVLPCTFIISNETRLH